MGADMRELFESGFGPEPDLPPVQDRVRAGRRALRRRRIAAGSAAVLVSVAVAGAVQLAPSLRSSAPTPSDHVSPETPGDVERRQTLAAPVESAWTEHCGRAGQPTCTAYARGAAPVGLRADGTLTRLTSDVVIIKRTDALVMRDGGHEVAVEVRTEANPRPYWYVVERDSAGKVSVRGADPETSRIDFTTWAAAIGSGRTVAGAPSLVPVRVVTGS